MIDQKSLKRALENRFTLKYTSQAEIERELYSTFGETKTKEDEQPKPNLQYIMEENLLNHKDQDKRNTAYKRLYGYLTQRGFKRFVIQNMVNQKWLMMNNNYNMRFITYEDIETKNKIIAITQKGTLTDNGFKQNNTTERNTGFLYTPKNTSNPDTLFIFESCLDLFSFQQLIWLNKIKTPDNYISISLNGCSNRNYIYKTLNKYPSIRNFFICPDNDTSGIKSTEIIQRQLMFKTFDLRPILRDLTFQN